MGAGQDVPGQAGLLQHAMSKMMMPKFGGMTDDVIATPLGSWRYALRQATYYTMCLFAPQRKTLFACEQTDSYYLQLLREIQENDEEAGEGKSSMKLQHGAMKDRVPLAPAECDRKRWPSDSAHRLASACVRTQVSRA